MALIIGILLAGIAIFLNVNNYPGELAAFILAGLLLVSGLVGLIMQSFRDRSTAEPSPKRKLHIYRQIPCAIDNGLVDRLDQAALRPLKGGVDENQLGIQPERF